MFLYIFQNCYVKCRSSHRRCSVRKDVLTNFAKFTGKHLRLSLFFNKVSGLKPATLSKKRLWHRPPTLLKKSLWHRCFPVNFAKFLRTPFLQNTSCGCFCKMFNYYLVLQNDWRIGRKVKVGHVKHFIFRNQNYDVNIYLRLFKYLGNSPMIGQNNSNKYDSK